MQEHKVITQYLLEKLLNLKILIPLTVFLKKIIDNQILTRIIIDLSAQQHNFRLFRIEYPIPQFIQLLNLITDFQFPAFQNFYFLIIHLQINLHLVIKNKRTEQFF